MDKETRIKYLTELARSTQGEALKEHFEGLIEKLTDARTYDSEDFEMEGKTSIKAAAVLRKIITDLTLLKKEKPERTQNQYL